MKKYLKLSLLVLLCVFSITVKAEETNCIGGPGDTNCGSLIVVDPPKNETDKRFYADSDIVVDEDITKTAFFAGNNVNITSKIDGIAFIAGNSIIASTTSDYAFIAGNQISLKNFHAKDSFIAGNQINIENASDIRSIYASGSSISINSDYIQDLYLAGSTVTLKGTFDNVVIDAKKLVISGTIRGTLKVDEETEVVYGTSDTTINTIEKYSSKEIKSELEEKNVLRAFFVTKALAFVFKTINLLLVGFILVSLFKNRFEKLAKIKNDAGYVFGKIGLGLCALILIPILIIATLLTGFASMIGVLGIFIYIIAIMISTPMVAINYGNILLKCIKNEYLRYFIAILVLQIVKLIPVLGGLVGFLTLCLGIGLLQDLFKTEKKEK